jgi:hypothetical protein
MKNIFALLVCVTVVGLSSNAQDNKNVDAEKTKIIWNAGKIGGSHTGNVALKSGELIFDDGVIKSGKFILDMDRH